RHWKQLSVIPLHTDKGIKGLLPPVRREKTAIVGEHRMVCNDMAHAVILSHHPNGSICVSIYEFCIRPCCLSLKQFFCCERIPQITGSGIIPGKQAVHQLGRIERWKLHHHTATSSMIMCSF